MLGCKHSLIHNKFPWYEKVWALLRHTSYFPPFPDIIRINNVDMFNLCHKALQCLCGNGQHKVKNHST